MKNKTWGGRFKKSLHPLAASFNASIGFDHELYSYDILGSQVHAKMLAKQGLISSEEAELLVKTLDEIALEIQEGIHSWDDSYEDIHMFIEQRLIEKVGEPGKKLHTGRSRNDQVALDLRLYTRDQIETIMGMLHEVIALFSELSQCHAQDKMPGYTHLQQAQPITLGLYFEAYQHMFQRDMDRFQSCLTRMNCSPLGAGALAGSSLPLDRQFVANTLGFSAYIPNTLDAISDRDFVIEFCSTAALTMVHLSRLCEDLILWASTEFNFISLSDEFATGSSLMPNKKNPDVLELIRGKSGRVFGHLTAMLTMMKGLPMAYNKDMQEDKEALFDTVKTLKACLGILPLFMKSLHFNTETMVESLQDGYLNATAMLEQLVMQGVPFREAHHRIGALVLKAQEQECSLHAVQESPKPVKNLLTGMELSEKEILELLELAADIKKDPKQFARALQGKTLVMLFDKPSFRTRLSFHLAIESMGGRAIESVGTTRKAEEPRDSVRVLNGYCDYIMVRTHEDKNLEEMAAYSKVPIINGLSALYHPCQTLADLLSLQEHFGSLQDLTLAYIGVGNNILHTLLLMAPKVGLRVAYCCPEKQGPDEGVLLEAQQAFGDRIISYKTPEEAVHQAHAVYTDVWVSMGFEPQEDTEKFQNFQVNEQLMSKARSEAVFMHCMPMERGKEVSISLPDAPCSLIFSQSENRLHVQKALLLKAAIF